MIARMLGGLIPYVQVGRDRKVVEANWWLEITWFRIWFRVEATR